MLLNKHKKYHQYIYINSNIPQKKRKKKANKKNKNGKLCATHSQLSVLLNNL